MLRKVIRISALDCPNVISGQTLIPGLITKQQYEQRVKTWDSRRVEIGLYGRFPSDQSTNLFPYEWFQRGDNSKDVCEFYEGPTGMGIDPGEGGDKTAIAVANKHGLKYMRALKTPDTSAILGHVKELKHKYNIKSNRIYTDRGGGGKQLADYGRNAGIKIRTIGFNESVTVPPTYTGVKLSEDERVEIDEQKYVYANKRAMMYGELSEVAFYVPSEYEELIRQLSLIPRTYKSEKLILLTKRKKQGSNEPCLQDIIGNSPDEADALVLAYYACVDPENIRISAGAF